MRTKPSRWYVVNWLVVQCGCDYDALAGMTYRELLELRRQRLDSRKTLLRAGSLRLIRRNKHEYD